MSPYICVTYAHEDQHPSDLFCRGLLRYGFRFCCIDERPDSEERREIHFEQPVGGTFKHRITSGDQLLDPVIAPSGKILHQIIHVLAQIPDQGI